MGRTHPNVLKIRKQMRQGRRAYLTSVFSTVHVPRKVGKTSIPEDAQPLFDYRSRGIQNPELEAYLNRIFPGVKQISLTRKYCLDEAELVRLEYLISDPDVCDYITIRQSAMLGSRTTMVYNRQQTRVYFLEIAYRNNGASYIQKSKVYGSKARALFDLEHNRVSWLEHLPLASLELVLPRRGTASE